MRTLTVTAEVYPIRGSFRISREERTETRVVVATISDGNHTGHGECVPYPRYKESVEGVVADIEAMAEAIAGGLDRDALQSAMPPGAARCAWRFARRPGRARRRSPQPSPRCRPPRLPRSPCSAGRGRTRR
ncbi:MAG: hypothetical protein AAGF49_14120, partial [Pseudomonadota bacterium]